MNAEIDELPGIFDVLLGDIQLLRQLRAKTHDPQTWPSWAAWAAAAAMDFEAPGPKIATAPVISC